MNYDATRKSNVIGRQVDHEIEPIIAYAMGRGQLKYRKRGGRGGGPLSGGRGQAGRGGTANGNTFAGEQV